MMVAPLGDSAVIVTLGARVDEATTLRVRALAAELERRPLPGTVDVVPAFASVGVFFDAAHAAPLETVRAEIEAALSRIDAATVGVVARTVEIPVCYGGAFGPDLPAVAEQAGLSPADVAARHAGGDYRVHAVGFAPGFPYLGGLAPELATPRLATPRPRVEEGSVGIGGTQTGVYPIGTPGGWNLIGRTPLRLFDPARSEPSLLRAGDRVVFRRIASEEFSRLEAEVSRPSTGATPAATAGSPGIRVIKPGMYTTVQDLGRRGHRGEGVPLSGAADSFSLRVANLLVGNPEGAPALEFTLVGPTLAFDRDTVVAVTGAEFDGLPRWRPIEVKRGTEVSFGPAARGCRGYLAVAGGFDVPAVLGSSSTYVRAGLGGVEGRTLREGDHLAVFGRERRFRDHWSIDERLLPDFGRRAEIRVVEGAHAQEFDERWMEQPFSVSSQSDRMGVRLVGTALRRTTASDLVSAPVVPGTVQVPPDGQPIVLLADAQTIGGYPRLAHVISVDLPRVAQVRPGEEVAFLPVSLDEARERVQAQERRIGLLREGIAQKLA